MIYLAARYRLAQTIATHKYITVKPWSEEERLLGEKETLGLYLTGHPITRYENELAKFITTRIVDLKPHQGQSKDQTFIVAGLVIAVKILNTKSGNRIAFLTLDDRTARVEVAVFADVFAKYRDLISKDQLLIVEGDLSIDDFTGATVFPVAAFLTLIRRVKCTQNICG